MLGQLFNRYRTPRGRHRLASGRGVGSGRAGRLVIIASIAAGLVIAPPGASSAPALSVAADNGASVTNQHAVNDRMLDLTVASPSLNGETPVRLLLPPGWHSEPTRTWPVLYLMHGCCHDIDNDHWTNFAEAAEFFADKDAIVVLPGNGDSGYYSEHWNYGSADTRSNAEYFHTTELVQILQRGYRADTNRMAVAGLSLAGYGAMEYAARHPGLFKSAAAYSAYYLDTQIPGIPQAIYEMRKRNNHDPYALWGHWIFQGSIWREHNPAANVDNLRGTNLFVSSGTGLPGEHDKIDPNNLEAMILGPTLEGTIFASSLSFVEKARLRGVPVTTDFYPLGTHNWPYWNRELRVSWPVLAKGLGLPA